MLDRVSITVSDITAAERRTQVDAFWDACIAAGGSDDGPPGLRSYHASYYAALLRDPDGNRLEAVCHHPV
jgi:predicted lactoylglutathione lyase